jgi:DNA-binding MarR family transcriptional regulator
MERELPVSLLMFIASRAAANRIFEALLDKGFNDVTIAQSRLMMGIDPDGTRLSVLAERAQIAKQTATALVDKLERAGYVERVADPTDGRARLVRMTARAKSAIPHARAEEQRIEEEWRAHLGDKRMKQLREALTELREITDPYP